MHGEDYVRKKVWCKGENHLEEVNSLILHSSIHIPFPHIKLVHHMFQDALLYCFYTRISSHNFYQEKQFLNNIDAKNPTKEIMWLLGLGTEITLQVEPLWYGSGWCNAWIYTTNNHGHIYLLKFMEYIRWTMERGGLLY